MPWLFLIFILFSSPAYAGIDYESFLTFSEFEDDDCSSPNQLVLDFNKHDASDYYYKALCQIKHKDYEKAVKNLEISADKGSYSAFYVLISLHVSQFYTKKDDDPLSSYSLDEVDTIISLHKKTMDKVQQNYYLFKDALSELEAHTGLVYNIPNVLLEFLFLKYEKVLRRDYNKSPSDGKAVLKDIIDYGNKCLSFDKLSVWTDEEYSLFIDYCRLFVDYSQKIMSLEQKRAGMISYCSNNYGADFKPEACPEYKELFDKIDQEIKYLVHETPFLKLRNKVKKISFGFDGNR